MNQRVRLVLYTDSLYPSGVGHVMETLARQLCRQEYDIFLACADDAGTDELVERMRPYVQDVARYTVRDDREDLTALHGLVRQLTEWKPDLFHNHIGATWEGSWGTLAARCAEIPFVVATEHLPNVLENEHELRHRRDMNRLLDRIYTVSESVRQSLLQQRLAPAQQVVTVENGISGYTIRCRKELARRELGIPDAVPVALFLGRLVEQKDPTTLLKAARLLRSLGDDLLVLLAGEGPLLPELEALAARLEMGDRIRFLGNRADVERLLTVADVLALPSRFEGLPLSVLEAMSVGLPVVGCDAPGLRDAVAHDVNGWLAPIGDHEDFARGLRLALSDSPGRRWAQCARYRFAQRFTAEAMAERQCAQYERLLEEGAAAKAVVDAPRRLGREPRSVQPVRSSSPTVIPASTAY